MFSCATYHFSWSFTYLLTEYHKMTITIKLQTSWWICRQKYAKTDPFSSPLALFDTPTPSLSLGLNSAINGPTPRSVALLSSTSKFSSRLLRLSITSALLWSDVGWKNTFQTSKRLSYLSYKVAQHEVLLLSVNM